LKKIVEDSNKINASESNYLFVATSQLPKAGKGLFCCIPIYKDEIVALFKGEILTNRQVKLRVKNAKDHFFICMLDGSIMDSQNATCFAKYANDAEGYSHAIFKNNAKISIDENKNVCIIATRKIKPNEEIFCSYGKRYWNKHRK
jgi:SET domain-containing protein